MANPFIPGRCEAVCAVDIHNDDHHCEPMLTLPGPDGFPNETVSAEKFSHLTTEWDG